MILFEVNIFINGRIVGVFDDSKVTHSFISFDYVKSLDFLISSITFNVVMSTPTNKPLTISHAYLGCSITIHGKTFLTGFICMQFSCFNVAL